MTNALIFSPGLDGHRQVYVFVIAHILKKMHYNISIACDFQGRYSDTSYIDKLKLDNSIKFFDTSSFPSGGLKISIEDFIQLQKELRADITILAEADNHIPLLTSQVGKNKKCLVGKTIGIFLRPFHFYHRLSFKETISYTKYLRSTWRFDPRFFHEFLLKYFHLLDVVLHIDEFYVSHHLKYCTWLPDMFQQYAESLLEEVNPEQQIWITKVTEFKLRNQGRFVFLYFGTAQQRRGYDLLLKMAITHNGCFIHCGLNDEKEIFSFNIDVLKAQLNSKGRLFETNQYISDPGTINYFFSIVSHLILPYRNFVGSSGVMLQALGNGIPVLVPENGIMGYRVNQYSLGKTFKKEADLNNKFKEFIAIPTCEFKEKIENYMKQQTIDNLGKTLNKSFSLE
jgi:hypothetical protein